MTRAREKNARIAATALLALGATAELVRVAIGVPWGTLPPQHSHTISVALAIVWTASAAALWLGARGKRWTNAAWFLSFVAALSMFMHGLVSGYSSRTLGVGSLYLVAAVLLAFLLRNHWAGPEYARGRERAISASRGDARAPR